MISGSPAAASNVGSQGNDTVEDQAFPDLAWPAYEVGHPPTALPVRILFTAERSNSGIRPAIVVGPVVRRVHHDGVVGYAQIIQLGQHSTDILVMGDHDIVVISLIAALALVLFGAMGAKVHGSGVVPDEEGLPFIVGLVDEVERMLGRLIVDCFHTVPGQRTSVFDLLSTHAIRPTVQHASGSEVLFERRVLRIIRILGFLLRVEVVEVAEKLVEAMLGRKKRILVPQMVLAELARGVSYGFSNSAIVGSSARRPTSAPGMPTLVRPVRIGFCPVMNAARPAVQLCCP